MLNRLFREQFLDLLARAQESEGWLHDTVEDKSEVDE
jgi:hypothetical protein